MENVIIAFVFFILLPAVIVGIAVWASMRHEHKWGKWSEPDETKQVELLERKGFEYVPVILQKRTCETCGLYQARRVR